MAKVSLTPVWNSVVGAKLESTRLGIVLSECRSSRAGFSPIGAGRFQEIADQRKCYPAAVVAS